MATHMVVTRPQGGQDKYEVDKAVRLVVDLVNDALQTEKKFVSLKLADGKMKAFIASEVLSIWEE